MAAVSARFGTDSAALALNRLVPDRLPAVAFAVRIWHRTAVGARTSPFNIFGCGCSSVVEHDLAKVGVEGSSPFARSKVLTATGTCVTVLLTGDLRTLCGPWLRKKKPSASAAAVRSKIAKANSRSNTSA